MRGQPKYTLHSVAFPQLETDPGNPSAKDSLGVSFQDGEDGGTFGEFSWVFYRFGNSTSFVFGRETAAVRLEVFGDGLSAFYDDRIQRVMGRWRRMGIRDNLTPQTLIKGLEAEGIGPSRYHTEGLTLR